MKRDVTYLSPSVKLSSASTESATTCTQYIVDPFRLCLVLHFVRVSEGSLPRQIQQGVCDAT